ncbi:hypothetical protein CsSME_00046637 [Camellia sinensis var. sinensis]
MKTLKLYLDRENKARTIPFALFEVLCTVNKAACLQAFGVPP